MMKVVHCSVQIEKKLWSKCLCVPSVSNFTYSEVQNQCSMQPSHECRSINVPPDTAPNTLPSYPNITFTESVTHLEMSDALNERIKSGNAKLPKGATTEPISTV